MAEIKDVVIEDGGDIGGAGVSGHPSLPDSEYPGYAVGYPTCSEPTKTNRGCDAWNKCATKGEGPYTVMFVNPSGRKTATHCRNWMYKLQFKQGLGYRPVEDEWMECRESVALDPSDVKKGTKIKSYKMKVEGVRMPYPESSPGVTRSGYLREDDKTKGKKARVGSQGDGKGRSRAKGTDEGSGSSDE